MVHKKVGAWLRRALLGIGGQGEALPLPAGGARERQLGWHAVPTLPEAKPTLPEAVLKGEPGTGK